MPDVQPLLVERRPDRARELERREDRVERGLSALVAAGALACIVVASPSAPDLRWLAVAIVAAAAAASVRLYVGGGSATAAVLGVVPMLWVLPLAWVPAAVVASQCLAALPGAITGRHRPWRVLSAVGDAGYVFGPVLFLLALTDGAPPVLLMPAALAVQFALDATLSVLREWLGRGIRPELQLDAMLTVFAVDALLLPIAVVIALQAELRPEVLLALVPFCVLLAAIARERNARVCEAADRVSALEVERDRIDIAMHRTSRSLAAPLDGLDALEVAVGTTVDALGAAAGRARFAGSHDATVFESLPRQTGAAESSALLAAERSALAGHDEACCEEEGWFALAVPVRRADARESTAAISICRAEHPFSDSERRLFGYLVAQASAALERGDLLGRVAAQERLDPLLGIANRHSLRDELNRMLELAEQTETPLSVLMLDVDGLRHVNETYGEDAGDAVLQAIGAFALERCRHHDLAARYEEDTLVLVLSGTSLEGARLVAEDVRTGVGRLSVATALEVPLTVSVGIAERSPIATSAEVVLDEALRALHDAKLGRGR